RRRGAHRALLALAHRTEHLDEELLLGGEMAIQGARGDPGALGDRQHRGGAIAALLDELARGEQQALAGRGGDSAHGPHPLNVEGPRSPKSSSRARTAARKPSRAASPWKA